MIASRRDLNVDCLRALAALGVIAGHGSPLAAGYPWTGLTAMVVEHITVTLYLFFAVSGYLIAGPYVRALVNDQPFPDTMGYAVRRAARILPAYWVALAAYLLIAQPVDFSAMSLAVHIPIAQGLFPHQPRALYPIAWTLGVEVLFYVTVPLAAHSVRRWMPGAGLSSRLPLLLLTLSVASVVLAFIAAVDFPPDDAMNASGGWAEVMNFSLPGCLVFFVPGIVIAYWEARNAGGARALRYARLRSRPLLCGAGAVVVTCCGLMLAAAVSPPTVAEGVARVVVATGCGLGVLAAVAARSGSWWPVRVLGFMGTVSYGLYLWHYIVLNVIERTRDQWSVGWLFTSGPAVTSLLLLAATLPFAIGSWYLIEQPLMQKAHRFAQGRRTPAVHTA